MSRVVVTGADGFVGATLVPWLADAGHQVTAVVRSDRGRSTSNVRYVGVADLEEAVSFPWLAGADVIVHLVARTHSADLGDVSARPLYERTNVGITRNLAIAAAANGVGRFVFLSSVKVNGERTFGKPFRETDVAAPEDLYGQTKLMAEQALHDAARTRALDVTVIRAPLIHGPGVKGNFLRLFRCVDRRIPLPLGCIHNSRSLIGLNNLCDAIASCMLHPGASGRTFLISDGEDCSTPGLMCLMAESLCKRAILLPVPVAILRAGSSLARRSGDFDRLAGSLQVDSSELRRQIGWTPVTSMATQMLATADWYRQGPAH